MGNVETYHYDPNGNIISMRIDGGLIDVPGDAANVRLYERADTYDEMDRVVFEETEFFDTETQAPILDGQSTTVTAWSNNSRVVRVVNDNNHELLATYDTAGRRSVIADAKGNTLTLAYDANSNMISITEVEKPDLGGPDEIFTTTYTYDGLDRRIQTVDNVGNNPWSVRDPLRQGLVKETKTAYKELKKAAKVESAAGIALKEAKQAKKRAQRRFDKAWEKLLAELRCDDEISLSALHESMLANELLEAAKMACKAAEKALKDAQKKREDAQKKLNDLKAQIKKKYGAKAVKVVSMASVARNKKTGKVKGKTFEWLEVRIKRGGRTWKRVRD